MTAISKSTTSPIQIALTDEKNASFKIKVVDTDVRQMVKVLVEHQIPFEISFNPTYSEKKITSSTSDKKSVVETKSTNHEMDKLEEVYVRFIKNGRYEKVPTIAEIAAGCQMSPNRFKKEFEVRYGKPFFKLFMEARMEKAASLLKKGYKCNEVTQMIGYGEKSSIKFNKMFQKHFGMTPKKYQLKYYGSVDRR